MSGDQSDDQNLDDLFIEEEVEEKSSFAPASETKLKEKLKKCTDDKQEYLDGWQRSKADLINQRKEFAESQKKLKTFSQNDFFYSLLPALDSFDMAFRGEAWEKVDETWRKGVEYIQQQFISALEQNGISSFSPKGETVDPLLHDPIEIVETTDSALDNTVHDVIQVGYKRGKDVIRPAKVIVAQYKDKN